jgi:predicted TPR repeat methyltransferase
MFIKPSNALLASIGTDSERIPTIYYSGNALITYIFWLRLKWIARRLIRFAPRHNSCLDFGGGGGPFLPTLSNIFKHTTLLDLETTEAEKIKSHYQITNVEINEADARYVNLNNSPFDAIVAADVLEHFKVVEPAIKKLHDWLADDGVLVTSLPTENWVYALLRIIFGVKKPDDHYHSGYEVEKMLIENGFSRVHHSTVPLYIPLAPLYLISVWKKS